MTSEVGVMMAITAETQNLALEVKGVKAPEEDTEPSQSKITVPPTTSDTAPVKSGKVKETTSPKAGSSDDDRKEPSVKKREESGGTNTKQKYSGTDIEMKYMIRTLLGMGSNAFAEAGQKLLLRTHILDLRCPEFEQTTELPESNIREAQFDAIRINSWSILKMLSKLAPRPTYSKGSVPYVFWKPFDFFFENLDYLEGCLGELKANRQAALGNLQEEPTVAADPTESKQSRSEPSSDTNPLGETDDELEINDLEFFIQFVKKNLKEDLEKQRKFQSGEATEVAFCDLHNLFRQLPGSYVAGYFNDVLRAYQIAGVGGGGRQVISEASVLKDSKESTAKELLSPLKLYLFYLDFNGNHFSAVHEEMEIQAYDGMLPIKSLKVFPINFLSPEEKAFLEDRGEKFLEYAKGQAGGRGLHKYCTGISLNEVQGSKDQVDSPVIIDHVFALQHNPLWAIKEVYGVGETPALSNNWLWSGISASNSVPTNKTGMAGDWVNTRNKRFFLDQCMHVRKQCSGSIFDQVEMVRPIKYITHMRVFAFVLRNRTWVYVNIDDVGDMARQREGFDALVLPKGHKELVKALVQMHSQPPQTSAPSADESLQLDLVRGKGKGLIVLLHGAPGVGKTSTAECVAEYAGKPLFPITCGDIGYEPQDVAKNLGDSFRLAHKWDCVLLLDEADIFLARRDRVNLKRNSLVSIFLRVLEYYSGILFLTTNRVGTFDEAFKSRVHMSLYYPELSKKAYLRVWEMNLNRVQQLRPRIKVEQEAVMVYAKKKYSQLQWNGRQIRNAVQTALALAEFRAQNSSPTADYTAVIGKEDFQKVTKASKEFESYLLDVYGGHNDTDRARNDMLRAGSAPVATASGGGAPYCGDSSSSNDSSSERDSSSSESSHTKAKREKGKKKKSSKKAKKAKKRKDSDSDSSS